MLTLKSRVCRAQSPLTTEVEGEVVMLDISSGNYFNLDNIGADIWNRISDPIEIDKLCVDLRGQYDADIAVIQRDVLDVLNRMMEARLVTVLS
jgi:hypothetical protein